MDNGHTVLMQPCGDYEPTHVREALQKLLNGLGGLDWVKPGMKVGIKLNLCGGFRPERAATTHPAAAAQLTKLLTERGARVILGDSPGEPFAAPVVNRIYHTCGLGACEEAGGTLNKDFSSQDAEYPDGKILKSFPCTSWILECDAVISFCKLKSHGLMSMTAAVKNTFGIVPGTRKSEMHFRYREPADFADMLVDLNEFLKPVLYLCDAVDIMEGNGPTAGTPRHMGLFIGSRDPYRLDRHCAYLIGVDEKALPYLEAAKIRGLLPEEDRLDDPETAGEYRAEDFVHSGATSSWFFPDTRDSAFKRFVKDSISLVLRSKPALGEGCVGCGHCASLCPAKAITIRNGRASINRRACVHCFCCQEFCPTGAMKVKRSLIARIIQK